MGVRRLHILIICTHWKGCEERREKFYTWPLLRHKNSQFGESQLHPQMNELYIDEPAEWTTGATFCLDQLYVCIWRNTLVFHFVSSSTLIYGYTQQISVHTPITQKIYTLYLNILVHIYNIHRFTLGVPSILYKRTAICNASKISQVNLKGLSHET